MPGRRALVAYRLHALSGLAIGPSGLPAGADGLPSVAGTTIKGTVRRVAAQLIVTLGAPVCRADGDESCAVCRLFGAPGLEAAVRWSDAVLVRDGDDHSSARFTPPTERRLRQPVGRDRRVASTTAAPPRLLSAPDLTFAGRAEGRFAGEPDGRALRDLAMVAASLRLVARLGAGRGVGHGRVTVELTALELDGQRYDADVVLDSLVSGERT